MPNPVVEALTEALGQAGYTTLRFNFRGVGRSRGFYEGGEGEQQDCLAAAAFLEARGMRSVLPAGYSFGSWVVANASVQRPFLPALFVAPPYRMFPFAPAALAGRVGLVVCGDQDPHCPLAGVRALAAQAGCAIEVLAGEDHFFEQGLERLAVAVTAYGVGLREKNVHP